MEEYEGYANTSYRKRHRPVKIVLVVIILLLIAAVGFLYWKQRNSGWVIDISVPDAQDLKSILKKEEIGVKEEEDGSLTFTDRPKEGMTIIELPSPEIYKGKQYNYGPGIVFPPESEEEN